MLLPLFHYSWINLAIYPFHIHNLSTLALAFWKMFQKVTKKLEEKIANQLNLNLFISTWNLAFHSTSTSMTAIKVYFCKRLVISLGEWGKTTTWLKSHENSKQFPFGSSSFRELFLHQTFRLSSISIFVSTFFSLFL